MTKKTRNCAFFFALIVIFSFSITCRPEQQKRVSRLKFALSFPEDLNRKALDGRLLLMLTTRESPEPRFQISNGPEAIPIFGIDVEGWKPGDLAVIDADVFGFPVESIGGIPAGAIRFLSHKFIIFQQGRTGGLA